jgi:hypothetical protein
VKLAQSWTLRPQRVVAALRPARIYEGALLLFTEISCNYRDSTYKRE